MGKDKLEKRQVKYRIGSVVEFTHRLPYWTVYPPSHKKSKGIVTQIGDTHWRSSDYWIKIKLVDYPKDREVWVRKSDHVRLVSKNTAIMESL